MTDFDTLRLSTVGFDDVLQQIKRISSEDYKPLNYPPYNIIKKDQNTFIIEIAVAGFNPDDLEVEIKENQLRVQGKSNKENTTVYLYKGISNKSFERVFTLADTVRVNEVEFEDGLLKIHLENVIPEHKKPRKLQINGKYISNTKEDVAKLPGPPGKKSQ